MTQKQLITANNAELEKHKQDILSLPMADDVKNGKYVWKKYEYTPAETIQVINPKSTLTYYKSDSFKVSSDDYNVNSVDISFFNGFTLAVAKYDQYIINDGYVTINGGNIEVVYDKTNAILTIKGITYSSSDSGTLNYNGIKTYEKEEKIGGLIGYTVSDSETAYPDGGEKDGFWWEKVEKVVTGIDFGEVTQSKAQKTITVEHSLGVVPKFAVLVPYEVEIPQYETLFWISAFGAKRAYPNLYNSGWQCILSGNDYVKNLHEEKGKPTATDKTISFISGSSQFFASGTYYWFAIA